MLELNSKIRLRDRPMLSAAPLRDGGVSAAKMRGIRLRSSTASADTAVYRGYVVCCRKDVEGGVGERVKGGRSWPWRTQEGRKGGRRKEARLLFSPKDVASTVSSTPLSALISLSSMTHPVAKAETLAAWHCSPPFGTDSHVRLSSQPVPACNNTPVL